MPPIGFQLVGELCHRRRADFRGDQHLVPVTPEPLAFEVARMPKDRH
jgi:hypothetical protein